MYDRIRIPKAKKVKVKDKEKCYSAVILQQKGNQYFVHYKDYSFFWDDWVSEEKIKFLEK
jgi:hypothetical protein